MATKNPSVHNSMQGLRSVEYGADQHRQCRTEIAKYKAKGPNAARYWLAVNRPIKDRALRDELESDLRELVQNGKVAEAELLDKPLLMKRLEELAMARLSSWAETRRAVLFEFYKTRMKLFATSTTCLSMALPAIPRPF